MFLVLLLFLHVLLGDFLFHVLLGLLLLLFVLLLLLVRVIFV